MDKSILICDDDPGILDVCKCIFEDKGYKVTVLCDGKNIIPKIMQTKPGLIILDLWMPEIRGEDIAIKIKANKKISNIPIIILSADQNIQKITERIGADAWISKPFDVENFEEMVEKFIYTNTDSGSTTSI